jgi:hypothetical protein
MEETKWLKPLDSVSRNTVIARVRNAHAGEGRLNRIKATAFFGVIIPLVATVVCSTPREPERNLMRQIEIMWCAYSIEPVRHSSQCRQPPSAINPGVIFGGSSGPPHGLQSEHGTPSAPHWQARGEGTQSDGRSS